METKAAKALRLLSLPKKGPFDSEIGSRIPEAYKKFYREWKWMKPAAVHHIPETKKYDCDPVTGEVKQFQDNPIPVQYPKEHNEGLWGGEGVVRGFQKRHPLRRRVAHFWVPTLKKSVVYSEVLDKHVVVTVTERFLRLVHENYGFDHYLLKTPACDLKSDLALKFKRKILLALENNDFYPDNPSRRQEVYNMYKHYLTKYNHEDIEWYGLTLGEAFNKQMRIDEANNVAMPLKTRYRLDLLERLKEAGIEEASTDMSSNAQSEKSWLFKINPFSKEDKSTKSDQNT